MLIKNAWYMMSFADALAPKEMVARTICAEPIVLFRTASGAWAALEDRCPHRQAPLSRGCVMGEQVQCGYHGATFNTQGRCESAPGHGHISVHAWTRAYPVEVKQGLVWVWMGEAEAADATQIPDLPWLTNPAWVASRGYHKIAANFQLLNDNLLDLSHETYVHGKTIGHSAVAESDAKVWKEGAQLKVVKEMPATTAPPFYQRMSGLAADVAIRRWQHTTFTAPSTVVIDVGVEPLAPTPGGNRVGGQVINLMTPETETSTHYFWAFARDCRLEEPGMTEYVRDAVGQTFDEDKEMLEAQQSRLNHPTQPTFKAAFRGDAAPTLGRQMVRKLWTVEQADMQVEARRAAE